MIDAIVLLAWIAWELPSYFCFVSEEIKHEKLFAKHLETLIIKVAMQKISNVGKDEHCQLDFANTSAKPTQEGSETECEQRNALPTSSAHDIPKTF